MIAEIVHFSANIANGAKTGWTNFFHGQLNRSGNSALKARILNKYLMSSLGSLSSGWRLKTMSASILTLLATSSGTQAANETIAAAPAPANAVGTIPVNKEVSSNPQNDPKYTDVVDWLSQTEFHGTLRAYFFERADSGINAPPAQNSFSLGGTLGVKTASLYGWQVGLTLGGANSLGLNPKGSAWYTNPRHYHFDQSVPAGTVYVLKEAYLKFAHEYFLLRGPDQVIDVPWIMASDSRITPSAYRGAYGEIYPFKDFDWGKDITFVGLRVFDFNGRSDGTFNATNLYMPGHMNGQLGLPELAGQTTPGAQAYALKYGKKEDALNAQLWWHQFYNFSQLWWLDANYVLKTGADFDPIFGFQFADQSPDGSNTLALAKQGVAASTQAYGALVGVDTPWVRLTGAYNNILAKSGTFQNGNLVSPYSWGYSTDPLYTTQMINGIIEKNTAGQAWKVAATSYFLDKQVKVLLSYAQYYLAAPNKFSHSHSDETDFDVTYNFAKDSILNGLSIRNRLGVAQSNITRGHDYYERFQIQYQF